jgi:hypothetical protein
VTQGQAGRSRVTRVPTASAPHARLPNAALRLPNAPRPETPRAPRRIIRVAHCPPVRRGFPCARADRGRSPYCELRPGCPVAVTARSPSPPIKQAAAGHPRVRREPAVPTVRSPTVRCTSYRLVHRHTFPRPPKSYPHRPLPFPGEGSPEQELPQRLPPGAAVHRRQPLLDPNSGPNRPLANPSPSPCPSLAGLQRALTGFEAEPRRPPPEDPIASPLFSPGF